MQYSLSMRRSVALFSFIFLVLSSGCTSAITVKPAFQPLPTLSLADPPIVHIDPNAFRFCYRDEPCASDAALSARYVSLAAEAFPSADDSPLGSGVRVMTEMRLVDDHQGRLFGYGLLFGPLAFLTPMPYPMTLDFLTISTTLGANDKPIRVYRSRQSVEFWTYSAWGLRDPKLIDAAMRHHLRALERNLQFDTALYQPPPAAPANAPATPPQEKTAEAVLPDQQASAPPVD